LTKRKKKELNEKREQIVNRVKLINGKNALIDPIFSRVMRVCQGLLSIFDCIVTRAEKPFADV
jgi:hypothetical protein